MYRVAMEQLARDDIAAAAAAHRELGRDYDGAVAEGLVERIGDEIDKRVDARLGQRGDKPAPHSDRLTRRGDSDGQLSHPGRPGFSAVILALGSMGLGIGAAAAVLSSAHLNASNNSGPQVALVALIWIIIGVINVACARRR
jgi:hypothetical protein